MAYGEAAEIRRRMKATGIGYAGIDGAWWLPATHPFALPSHMAGTLRSIGAAVFALLDLLAELYETDEPTRQVLRHAVPPHILQLGGSEPVLLVRPDFQLVPAKDAYRLVATELEICPAALGFAHAMQVGYGLPTDVADRLAYFLGGRLLLIVGTHQWSEFLFEQLALCRALAERGETALVLYDRPVADIMAEAEVGRRWSPPMFGVPARPKEWDVDARRRLRETGLDAYLWPGDWPQSLGNAVIFRFGYFDCFDSRAIRAFIHWRTAGATFLNPPITWLESKCILAAARLPPVAERLAALDPALKAMLDHCLPDTRLLTDQSLSVVLAEREQWIIKYAGFDGDNQAWGGRSVEFGRDYSDASWSTVLNGAITLPWPVIAQRLTPSARIDIDYYDDKGNIGRLKGGVTRLRSYLLRGRAGDCHAFGSHLTVSSDVRVSEGIDAVQTPIVFTAEKDS